MKQRSKSTLERRPAAVHVAAFLNENGRTAAGRRIQKLVWACQEYCAEVRNARKQASEEEGVLYPSLSLHRKLQALLHRYRYGLSVNRVVLRRGSSQSDFSYELDRSGHSLKTVRRLKDDEWLAAIAEGEVVPRVLQAIRDGQLDELRRCVAPRPGKGETPACDKWFFRPGKLHCETKCAQRAHERSPAYRESRALYMRDRYNEDFPEAKTRSAMRKY